MKSLRSNYFNPPFSHIYVEKSVMEHPRTKDILAKFPASAVISISHYKDVFCRRGQNYLLQHHTQNLILAEKDGTLIYQGAPVCQSFGNDFFYYTSCMMNCIYDCEYCYLKGMYPSANMVVFVNIEDIFHELEQMLSEHPVYLCVSYDTDLLALESVTGYADKWCRFVSAYTDECCRSASGCAGRLTIEIRTKCARKQFFIEHSPQPGVIYAFTLSPQQVIDAYEHGTPSLVQRISCAAQAVRLGHPVRLCFDPMIYLNGWQKCYAAMLDEVFRGIDMDKLVDVSVGTFRISQEYLKKMRKQEPNSAIAWFPYQNDRGFYHYPDELMVQMEQDLVRRLKEHMPQEKIFLWNE